MARYDPKGNGKDRSVDAVQFIESEPPGHLKGIVHRFIELWTDGTLTEDYRFHALPDACTYAVFDQLDQRISGVTQLSVQSEEFNLGRKFHFINIRFLPGIWPEHTDLLAKGQITAPYEGPLPLRDVNAALNGKGLAEAAPILSAFVASLLEQEHLVRNPVTEKIFENLDDIHNVADMAAIAGLSARQLQRKLKASTGFAPHDFLKVLRLQQSLNGGDPLSYADQSHFIHSFRRATGYTPGKYARKFDV